MKNETLDNIQDDKNKQSKLILILIIRTILVTLLMSLISIVSWLFPKLFETSPLITEIIICGIMIFNSRSIANHYFRQHPILQEKKISAVSSLSFFLGYLIFYFAWSLRMQLWGVPTLPIFPILLKGLLLSTFAYLITLSRVRRLYIKNHEKINLLILGLLILLVVFIRLI